MVSWLRVASPSSTHLFPLFDILLGQQLTGLYYIRRPDQQSGRHIKRMSEPHFAAAAQLHQGAAAPPLLQSITIPDRTFTLLSPAVVLLKRVRERPTNSVLGFFLPRARLWVTVLIHDRLACLKSCRSFMSLSGRQGPCCVCKVLLAPASCCCRR
jgi:hypothetical protein